MCVSKGMGRNKPIALRVILVVLFVLVTRLLLLDAILLVNHGNLYALIHSDESRYIQEAEHFFPLLRSTVLWDVPLYPFFLKVVFFLCGTSDLAAVYLSILFFSLATGAL